MRQRMLAGVSLVCCFLFSAAAPAETIVIRGASIVDVERGTLIGERDIVIKDGLIAELAPVGRRIDGPDVREIAASGLFAMPGLFDAHVHLTASIETYPPMMVAFGVTAARDLGGPTEIVIRARDDFKSGAKLGPELFVTGAIIDGDPPVWPFSEPCDTPEQGRAAVNRLQKSGVNMIKVYSRLKKDVYEAVIDEAHKSGLKVTGHIPESVTVAEAIAARQDCNEHLMRVDAAIAGLAGHEEERNRVLNRTLAGWAHFDEVPREKLLELARTIAASGMVQCPTIVVMQGIGRSRDEEAAKDPMLAYVPLHVREFWAGDAYGSWASYATAIVPSLQKTVAAFHEAGVPMMVGTDLANPFIFAGYSMHTEMALWQEAGVPAPAVLKAATIAPARFCGADGSLGSIAPGKTASLVLTRADPLKDVRNAREIEHVFLRGRHFDRPGIDALLKDVRDAVAAESEAPPAAAEPMKVELPGEEVARGTFRFTFGKFAAGDERFVISKTDDGYHIFADSRPKGGGSPPSTTTAHVSTDGALKRLEWNQQGSPAVNAVYTLEGDAIKAVATRGGEPQPEQITAMKPGHVFSPSATAWTFFETRALGLKPGESRDLTSLTYGFPDWRVQASPYKLTRFDDTTVKYKDGDMPCARYISELTTPMGVFKSEMWLDPQSIPYRVELTMPFGMLAIDRE